ncbi:MAG: Gfo/Idh/MocA family oxidoreductase [Trueperaceae bacterium]|nr:MAG: Gfo/Idh/MocA family oxidoreductase [Trueperaceae bacterium]
MRVGIVGAGSMGQAHAAAWATTGAQLVGVLSKSRTSAAALASRIGTRSFENFEALLSQVDIVDLCVPTDLHCEMTLRAAEAGKHVICEKPVALTLEDGKAMIDACEQAGVRLFIAMVVRFFPQYLAAQQIVAAGQLGELGVIRLKRIAYQPSSGDDWFVDEVRSGGMVLDLMVHDFDYACWLAGEVERVFAKSVRSGRPGAPGDYALATLRFKSGAMALVEGGWAYPPGVFRTALDIAGTSGLIEWASDDTDSIRLDLLPSGPQEVERVGLPLTVFAEDPYAVQIRHAYRAILTDEPFAVTAEEALEALRVGLAVRESMKTGRSVTLEEVV